MKILALYHGSPKREGRPSFGASGNVTPVITDGAPFFVTSNLAYAKKFARGGLITLLHVTLKKTYDLHDSDRLEMLLDLFNRDPMILAGRGKWDEDVDGEIQDSAYFLLESHAVTSYLKRHGYDSVLIPEDNELNVKSYALLDPGLIELTSVLNLAECDEPGMGR